MVVGCGGGGGGFWVLKPGGGNSNPNAWRQPADQCKSLYKTGGYDGLKNARMNGGNIAASWVGCGGGGGPIFFDPWDGRPILDPVNPIGPILPIYSEPFFP